MTIAYTRHAEARTQQRGIRCGDIELVLKFGTQTDDGTWFMRNRDVSREIQRRRHEIQALERLKSKKVVLRGTKIVTVYHSKTDDQKHTLRRGRKKGLVA